MIAVSFSTYKTEVPDEIIDMCDRLAKNSNPYSYYNGGDEFYCIVDKVGVVDKTYTLFINNDMDYDHSTELLLSFIRSIKPMPFVYCSDDRHNPCSFLRYIIHLKPYRCDDVTTLTAALGKHVNSTRFRFVAIGENVIAGLRQYYDYNVADIDDMLRRAEFEFKAPDIDREVEITTCLFPGENKNTISRDNRIIKALESVLSEEELEDISVIDWNKLGDRMEVYELIDNNDAWIM